MTVGIIELNDAGIRVGRSDGANSQLAESPGVAVVGRKNLLLGEAALRQSRLQPVETNSLFWHRLSAEPLSLQNNHYRHHADLAYSHLLSLHEAIPDCDEVIFALPGSFSREQMSLLLGIVGQCPFNAVGLVDSAVAASADRARAASVIHVDLQLHQCVFTRLQAEQEVQRTLVEVLPNCGLFTLRDQWAKAIADQFIDQSRFDPLHSATTEQSLYDQLPNWLQQSRENNELFLEVSGKNIKLTRDQLVSAVWDIYRQIVGKAEQLARGNSQILLGDRLAALPGLAASFDTGLGQSTEALPVEAIMRGVRRHMDAIKSPPDQLSFVQSLPAAEVQPPSTEAQTNSTEVQPRTTDDKSTAETRTETRATHVLLDKRAYPLEGDILYVDLKSQRLASESSGLDAQCTIRRQGDEFVLIPRYNTKLAVNGHAINDNKSLRNGDTVAIEGQPSQAVTLIEVVQGNGS